MAQAAMQETRPERADRVHIRRIRWSAWYPVGILYEKGLMRPMRGVAFKQMVYPPKDESTDWWALVGCTVLLLTILSVVGILWAIFFRR